MYFMWQSSSTGLSLGRISEFCGFSHDIRALPETQAAMELTEEIGEGFKNNFLIAMQDLKRRIKVGTAKTGATQFLKGV